MHGASRPQAHHVRQTQARALDLPRTGLAAQMGGDLVDIGDTGGAQGMTLREKSAGDIYRDASAEAGVARIDQPAPFTLDRKSVV